MPVSSRRCRLSLCAVGLLIASALGNRTLGGEAPELHGAWKQNGLVSTRFQISGTGDRSNPLRRQFSEPFTGEELFVRFHLRYDAASIDTPQSGDGEFFVLWLDATEGNDAATHSADVPNIGLHTSGTQNRFMVRYAAKQEKYGPELIGDQEYLLVARLAKSQPGESAPFDQLSLWIDPLPEQEQQPTAHIQTKVAINAVHWLGFSTGRKTEFGDRIDVWDIAVNTSWRSVLELPPDVDPDPAVMPVAHKTIDFQEHVFPILQRHCFECHAGAEPESELRLDVLDEVINQTAPRNAEQSHLIQVITQGEMPPAGDPLPTADVQTLRTWINEGLDWDDALLPTPVPVSTHWAFQPIARPEVPHVRQAAWVRTPVDAFVAERQETAGI
ncbi:MAG: hypothetical protein KDA58_16905, partial [Planctomycetaceae bacterium]|nr:hypothetical protein [Planctomycetaceae bacterium]